MAVKNQLNNNLEQGEKWRKKPDRLFIWLVRFARELIITLKKMSTRQKSL
jgi:hypothetical protein